MYLSVQDYLKWAHSYGTGGVPVHQESLSFGCRDQLASFLLLLLAFQTEEKWSQCIFLVQKDLGLPPCHHSLALHSRLPSPRLSVGRHATNRDQHLSQSTHCCSAFQSLQGTHGHAREQSYAPRYPLFSWSRCLCLMLVKITSSENMGGGNGTWLLCCAMNMVQVWGGVCESDGQLGEGNWILKLLRA